MQKEREREREREREEQRCLTRYSTTYIGTYCEPRKREESEKIRARSFARAGCSSSSSIRLFMEIAARPPAAQLEFMPSLSLRRKTGPVFSFSSALFGGVPKSGAAPAV